MEGFPPPSISKRLKRHPHTVWQWLKRFQSKGLMALQRNFFLVDLMKNERKAVKEIFTEILSVEPTFYGYKEFLWSVPLIVHYFKNSCNPFVSDDTVEGALKSIGFSYKRPSKSVSPKAPDKETKKATVEKIVSEIKELMAGGNGKFSPWMKIISQQNPIVSRVG